MSPHAKPRPVLLPLGWPQQADEREAFMRVLLAAGADVERMLDPAVGSSAEAFVRHATRLPFLKSRRDKPLVAMAIDNVAVPDALKLRQRLFDAVPALLEATWLVYSTKEHRAEFLRHAFRFGGLFDSGGGLMTWHVHQGVMGIVGAETWLVGLAQRLDELLEPTPESGIMPVEPPLSNDPVPRHVPTTEPAPPAEQPNFDEHPPYAAIATRSLTPNPRPSTVPPNPRLRR
jgi:hypothetical protein